VLDFLYPPGWQRPVSRLLTLLAHHHRTDGRYISLERIIEQTGELLRSPAKVTGHDGNHDITPWFNYFLSTIWPTASLSNARAAATVSLGRLDQPCWKRA
jgi:hypothetical protein